MNYQNDSCCALPERNQDKKSFWLGIIYGLVPHMFCIGFILFSVVGAVTATAWIRSVMLVPNFFYFLVIVSLVLAGISSVIYLKRRGCLTILGLKNQWKYVASLFLITIAVNFLMFFVAFPALANIGQAKLVDNSGFETVSAIVQVPCSGHAPLIVYELKKDTGIKSVVFKNPNIFEITYDSGQISVPNITSKDIFETFPIKIK